MKRLAGLYWRWSSTAKTYPAALLEPLFSPLLFLRVRGSVATSYSFAIPILASALVVTAMRVSRPVGQVLLSLAAGLADAAPLVAGLCGAGLAMLAISAASTRDLTDQTPPSGSALERPLTVHLDGECLTRRGLLSIVLSFLTAEAMALHALRSAARSIAPLVTTELGPDWHLSLGTLYAAIVTGMAVSIVMNTAMVLHFLGDRMARE